MSERLYTEYPELYDVIQSEWDYDRDISFIINTIVQCGINGEQLLEIGCGTGEHTRRLIETGFDVTAIDKYDGMLPVAQTKCDADFRQMTLPDLTIDGEYDVIVAVRGVMNHLSRDDLSTALKALNERLSDSGVIIFDNSHLPLDGNHPALDVGTTEQGDYARIAQHVPTEDGRLDWREIIFGPEGEFFANCRKMTPFDDEMIITMLEDEGFTIRTYDGYGPDDHRTVFVALA